MKDLGIAPLKGVRKFHSKQSVHGHMPETPFRLIALGKSGSGKTLTLQNMLLNHYKGVFTAIYLWSPTSRLDMGWEPVFRFMKHELGQNPEATNEEQCVFETFRNEDLVRVIDTFSAKIRKLNLRSAAPGTARSCPASVSSLMTWRTTRQRCAKAISSRPSSS